jgi:ankyrin repeat protein
MYTYLHSFLCVYTQVTFCVCVYSICSQLCMYSCACSLSSNRIDLYTVITCEYSQSMYPGMTALMWASSNGHADTVRVLVELGASVEAVDKVNIHSHALANTCSIKHVSGMMRMTMIMMSYLYGYICIYIHSHVLLGYVYSFFICI